MARLALLVLAASALLLGGCATPFRAPLRPPEGALVAIQRAPLQLDMERTRLGPRRGSATAYFVQDPIFTGINVAWGEASLESAARDGGLETVQHTDYSRFSILLGIFQSVTVHAYGE